MDHPSNSRSDLLVFVATMIASRKLNAILWKSSVLSLLMYRLGTEPEHDFDSLRNMDEVQGVSKKIKVIAEDNKGSLLLSGKLAG